MPVLPQYSGPYSVSFLDIETLSESSKSLGVLMRIFYPSESKKGTSPWLPSTWDYIKGYGQFLNVPVFLISVFMYPLLWLTKTRAVASRDILKNRKLPVVLFSHGLGGMRTTYSQIIANLASKGFIVVSIEHADGSGCWTSRMDKKYVIPHIHPKKEDLGEDETVKEYLKKFRVGQVKTRVNEVKQIYQVLKNLNDGKLDLVLDNKRVILEQFKDAFDFDNFGLMGHSFGAATCLAVLDENALNVKCAAVYDPWMFALSSDLKITCPVLNFQSHRFHWKENLDSLKAVVKNPAYNESSEFGYLVDTKHQDLSDFPLFFPWLMQKAKQSGPAQPQITHQVLDKSLYDFLQRHLAFDKVKMPKYDTEKKIIYGAQAFEDLYEAMGK